MNLPGDKVSLRPIHQSDFESIVYWTNQPEVSKFCDGDYPASLSECAEWFLKSRSNRYQERFMILQGDVPIGDIEFDHITWRSGDAELRVRIGDKKLWDQGLGTDAVRTLLRHGFSNMNLSRVYLKVYAENARAIRCYLKVGFKKEGRLCRRMPTGEMREIILMRALRSEFLRRQQLLENTG